MPEHQVVPSFGTVEELQRALGQKSSFQPADLYPRDGSCQLAEIEDTIAEFSGVQGHHELVLHNAGMSALVGAIGTCLTKEAVVAYAEQTYSQTQRYIGQTLAAQGVTVVRFDSGDLDSIDRVVKKKKPTIIVSETVGNGQDVPVLDVDGLLTLDSVQQANPYIILDNTLPLSTRVPLGKQLANHEKVLAVESGTKSYTFNRELSGFVYGTDHELIQRVRRYRQTAGTTPNVAALDAIEGLLPASPDTFHERNKAIFKATAELALGCFRASQEAGDFIVSHPALPTHDNHGSPYGDEITPVFFLQSTGSADQFELTERLWQNSVIREQCRLGQSFGFDETRILPNELAPIVRIAGGACTDAALLGKAFEEALVGARR